VRSSKTSEKLVLLPETADVVDDDSSVIGDEEPGPPRDEKVRRRRRGSLQDKSYAERLPKAWRTEKLARVTAYCTAQSYRLKPTAEFVRRQHGAKTKLYDDCLYTVYHLPLLPGSEGYRIRSSPVLKSPGGKAVVDEEIERNERREYQQGYFGDAEEYGVRAHESPNRTPPGKQSDGGDLSREPSSRSISPPRTPTDARSFSEMFVFSYGVVVFWNFTERQEKDILADLTFSDVKLAIRPQSESDFETEEFHFDYNPEFPAPRIFNDMITLKSGDHMIKLAMSHAVAQSTKLSFFEERMVVTVADATHVPRKLALDGKLGMKREEVVRIVGRLYRSRVDVNLSSNMLDVPNFFWDSEPTLHPLYIAVREYLEIKQRVQVLNERCQVFLDLAEILTDSIADKKMTRELLVPPESCPVAVPTDIMTGITWIIIILIIVSIGVTCTEVFLRFGILTKGRSNNVPCEQVPPPLTAYSASDAQRQCWLF
jgi:uncharacterized Rmd1/YagE family protein